MSARAADLIVIGTGSAGAGVAQRCRRAGWSVLVVESRPVGGTCALRGCDPKKILVGAADAVAAVRRLEGRGTTGDARIDWPALMTFKRSLIEPMSTQRERSLVDAGITLRHGQARFVGPTSVAIHDEVWTGRFVHIATGAMPATLGIPGEHHLTTSEAFLELESLPHRLAFVGGGFISFEFAHVAARAGAAVTILHRGPRPLPLFDPDLVDRLVAHSRDLGIDVQVDAAVEAVERVGEEYVVRVRQHGDVRQVAADLVVHGAGRVPEIADLALDAAGVEWDPRRGVRVNAYLQSVSNPAVFAAGDAADTGGPALTPVAGYEARLVGANLLEGLHHTADYAVVPSVAFTLPPLATVGMSEAAARATGRAVRVQYADTASWYSSRRIGETASASKVLIEEDSGRILGAHLLGPHADETINLFALAMKTGATAADLKAMIFAYPTHASDVAYMV
ncbi:MAG: NAD(P)/FAD-dependent oxidoreductase [Vicinamibacterales bacterium]|nr:NAD(P)/FAD-dependent oxidoreductase [Vicinamibacterales bacterium]